MSSHSITHPFLTPAEDHSQNIRLPMHAMKCEVLQKQTVQHHPKSLNLSSHLPDDDFSAPPIFSQWPTAPTKERLPQQQDLVCGQAGWLAGWWLLSSARRALRHLQCCSLQSAQGCPQDETAGEISKRSNFKWRCLKSVLAIYVRCS